MKITLHQLNVLTAVQEYQSITIAAQMLHVTQPAVSNILKQLEVSFEYALTETIGKKVFLTKAGERLVAASQAMNQTLEQAIADIHALHDQVSGTMTVTIVSTAKYFVPKFLGEFRRTHPLVKIKLTVCNRQEAISQLKNNVTDFVIMSQPPDDIPISQQLFYDDELVAVAAPEKQFQHKIRQLKDLNDEDWIIREPGSGTCIAMQRLFKQHKMLPNTVMEVGNNESIKQLIMANMGISIISRQSIELELEHELIQILPVAGFPLKHPWYIVMNKGKHIGPIVAEFLNFVHQHPRCHS